MGRALYSTAYAPVIREPSPSPYEKWSISNPFDPDSEEFFQGAQYEAFLPNPNSSANNNNSDSVPRSSVSATHSTRTSRVRISNEGPVSIISSSNPNPIVLDSVPHSLPDVDAPTLPSPPPPINLRDLNNEDSESSRPTLSAMAGDSDAEDPIRILSDFVTEYRTLMTQRDAGNNLNVSEILRQMDQEWRRQQVGQPPQRYLPPLDYSSPGSDSSRASSPTSPRFIPSPPPEALPSPPAMSREDDAFPVPDDLPLPFDEDLERNPSDVGSEFPNLNASPLDTPVLGAEPTIPAIEPQTPPRAVYIPRGTPRSFGHDVGLDMSPPPSVSPRLYNWSRTESEMRARFSPAAIYARRSHVPGRF